jgi:hypothetical protein
MLNHGETALYLNCFDKIRSYFIVYIEHKIGKRARQKENRAAVQTLVKVLRSKDRAETVKLLSSRSGGFFTGLRVGDGGKVVFGAGTIL